MRIALAERFQKDVRDLPRFFDNLTKSGTNGSTVRPAAVIERDGAVLLAAAGTSRREREIIRELGALGLGPVLVGGMAFVVLGSRRVAGFSELDSRGGVVGRLLAAHRPGVSHDGAR
jgi:hypothetical protein